METALHHDDLSGISSAAVSDTPHDGWSWKLANVFESLPRHFFSETGVAW